MPILFLQTAAYCGHLSLLKISEVPAGTQVIAIAGGPKLFYLYWKKMVQKRRAITPALVRKFQVIGSAVRQVLHTSPDPHGYDRHNYNSSFVGIAPLSNPRLVIAVVHAEETHGNHMGALVSAPVFAQVMSDSVRILNILPDQTSSHQ